MDETVLATEEATDPVAEPVTSPDETEAAASGDGSVLEEENEVSETMDDISTEESVLENPLETTEITLSVESVEVIQAIGLDIIQADLFGSFLLCGTLIGLALWRKVHGT